MKVLLDTHIWVWAAMEPHRLPAHIASTLSDERNEFWVSPVSTWEIRTLLSKRRLRFECDLHEWVPESIAKGGFCEAPLTHEVVLSMRNISLPHRDPADWLLAATARTFELTLATVDEQLLDGSGYACVLKP